MSHHTAFFRCLKALTILMICGYLMMPAAHAEGGCPDGSFPIGGGSAGWQGCAPMGGGEGEEESSGPQEVWETRWGSIAIGDGAFGAVEGAKSKEAAEAVALERCRNSTPNALCHIKVTYYDQCAALAWSDKGVVAFRGPDEEENKREAIANCKSHGDTGCRIFYSACSFQERVQ